MKNEMTIGCTHSAVCCASCAAPYTGFSGEIIVDKANMGAINAIKLVIPTKKNSRKAVR